MHRAQRIARDRATMLRKALSKAGYLEDIQSEKWTEDEFVALAASLLADLYHLAETKGVKNDLGDAIKAKASEYFKEDRDYKKSYGS